MYFCLDKVTARKNLRKDVLYNLRYIIEIGCRATLSYSSPLLGLIIDTPCTLQSQILCMSLPLSKSTMKFNIDKVLHVISRRRLDAANAVCSCHRAIINYQAISNLTPRNLTMRGGGTGLGHICFVGGGRWFFE